jgi:hypothetical protein
MGALQFKPVDHIKINDNKLCHYTIRPRLKLPHIDDAKKWASIDQNISEAFELAHPKYKKHGDLNKLIVFKYFNFRFNF